MKNKEFAAFLSIIICMCFVCGSCAMVQKPASTFSGAALDDYDDDKTKNEGADNFETDDFSGSGQTQNPSNATTEETQKTVNITLNGSSANADGNGVSFGNKTVTINSAGTYRIMGSFDGQLVVEAQKNERVYIILAGVNIKGVDNSAIWIKSADKTIVTLEENTINTLEDAVRYINMNTNGEPNACMFSKDDLTINGNGTLTVKANYNNGIATKDDLKITSGTINVTAQKNGIRGNDSVAIKGGTITVNAKNDGVKVTNEIDTDKGYILIESGNITVTSGDDALQATRQITASGCTLKLDAGGKKINCDGTVKIDEKCYA